MSVTFWMPDAHRELKRIPCDQPCNAEERCGYCQDGWEEQWVSDAPDLNLNNGNARLMLDALGINSGPDIYGAIEVKHIPAMRRQIVRALNRPLPTRAASRSGGADTLTYIECGLDAEGVRDRLMLFDQLLRYAQTNNLRVTWG